MTLYKFNEDFYKYRPEPQLSCRVKVLQEFYNGSGGRWYIDVEPEDKDLTNEIYAELAEKCPGTFVEGYMKLKIPMMKGVLTYTKKNPKQLDEFKVGDMMNVTISCAGMFYLKGVWKPSWKLKVHAI